MCEILRRLEGAACLPGSLDPGYLRFPEVANISQAQPHGNGRPQRIVDRSPPPPPGLTVVRGEVLDPGVERFDRAIVPRGIDVGIVHHHPVARCVLHQAVGTVEAHRIGIEKPGEKLGRPVKLQPGGHVDDVGEADGVALGEPERGEPLELLPDLVGGRTGDAVGGHSLEHFVAQTVHRFIRTLVGHCRAQSIRLVAVESGAHPGEFHQLLLEDGDTERLSQHRFCERVGVAHRLFSVPPPKVGMDRLPLDRPRPDERHLHGQVVEGLRLHLRQGRHLRPRLDLKDPDGVRLGEHAVDGRFLGNRGEVDGDTVGALDQVDGQV